MSDYYFHASIYLNNRERRQFMTYISTRLQKEIDINEIITIHYFEYTKDFIFDGESHDFWEFVYVDKGEILIQADETILPLKTGEIIFHCPNEFHGLQAIGNKAPNLVVISFRCDSESIFAFKKQCCCLNEEERIIISKIITEAKASFSTPLHIPSVEQVALSKDSPYGSQQLILIYLQLLLILIKRHHIDHTSISDHSLLPLTTRGKNDSRLDQIIRYMEIELRNPLSIETICKRFNLSRSNLHALFHTPKNCGVIEYFNLMKVNRAKELIKDSNMNFTEIAYYLSYSSLPYFSKQFKKITGMSPLEYAKSVKKYSNAISEASRERLSHAKDSKT